MKILYKLSGIILISTLLIGCCKKGLVEPTNNCSNCENKLATCQNNYFNLEKKNLRLQELVDDTLRYDTIYNYIDSIIYEYKDTLIYNYKDSIIYTYEDSIIYNYKDSIIYEYKDSIIYNYIDSITYDTIVTFLFAPPDTTLFRFVIPTSIMKSSFLIRPVIDCVAYPFQKQLKGSIRIKNRSDDDYECDNSIYIGTVIYDSTFSEILFTKNIIIPSIMSQEELNIDWNSGEWIFPYKGWYYIRRVFYKKIDGYEDQPIRGFYIGIKID